MGLLLAVSAIVSLVNLTAFVIVLIQLFKAKGAGHGIAGLCCGLYTLIWGWQNADQLDVNNPPVIIKYKQWMLVWSICIAVNIVLNIALRTQR